MNTEGKLSPDDVGKIKMCYEKHVKSLMTSDAGKKTDGFITKIFDDKCMETICTDKTCQDKVNLN